MGPKNVHFNMNSNWFWCRLSLKYAVLYQKLSTFAPTWMTTFFSQYFVAHICERKSLFGPSPLHVPGPISLWNGSGDHSLCTGHEIWGGVRNRVKQFTPSWPWSRVCGAVFLTRGYEWQAMHLMLQDPWARKQVPDYLSSTPSSSHPPFRRPFWLDSSFENKIQGLKKCV